MFRLIAFLMLTAAFILPAQSQSFYGGMSEGMQQRRAHELRKQQLEQQRRMMERGQRPDPNAYDSLVRQQQMDRLNRELRETNRLLKRLERQSR